MPQAEERVSALRMAISQMEQAAQFLRILSADNLALCRAVLEQLASTLQSAAPTDRVPDREMEGLTPSILELSQNRLLVHRLFGQIALALEDRWRAAGSTLGERQASVSLEA